MRRPSRRAHTPHRPRLRARASLSPRSTRRGAGSTGASPVAGTADGRSGGTGSPLRERASSPRIAALNTWLLPSH
ncbi:hypothetical protein HYPSUDRAFT_44392 [Hypholoma sublateritium FD-334 SS-4]|uniref:Uncharacterized protein n=1 Tax=Hypholoma sublateritium (strain FD-334 SS-4) TaxID=945553 RepID=A0A0D2NKC2_HYPSF|nr:hypothetical protein HYPSUDRAFT_44392 [Hypholoma sublateritium FD-334 SS-4]